MAQADFAKIRIPNILTRRTAWLVCGAAWLVLTLPALTQELQLRGGFDNEIPIGASPAKNKVKKKTRQAPDLTQENVPLPEYRPISGNGLPEENLDGTALPAPSASNGEDIAVLPEFDSTQDAAASPDDSLRVADRPAARALASEVPDPAATAATENDEDPDALRRTRPDNQREPAIEGQRRTPEEDPYAAPGISAGSFTIRPTLETGLRWTSNSDNSANGTAALLSESALRLRAESNWSQHRLNLEAFGAWQKSVSGAETNDPEAGLSADFQLDLPDRTALTGALGWTRSREAASAPATVVGALTRPDLDALTGSLGVSRDVGKFSFRARANAARSIYGDAIGATGAAVSQDDRNNTYAGLTLRTGYHVSAALAPFIEGEIGRRVYDNELDSFGLARAATRYAIRAGVEADFGEKLRGDFALGYLVEDIEAATLEDVSGLSLSGNLNWSPMRGTNVALSASTTVEGSSTATSAGSLLHALNLSTTTRARANLDLSANLGASLRDYAGPSPNEVTLSAGAGFTYWFNRYAGINSRIAHETVLSDDATRQSQTNSIYVGVTLRR